MPENVKKFRHLDLFSGIQVGGFALSAQNVWGVDYEPIAFCEIDKFCQKVLKKHWPDVKIVNDVKEITENQWGKIDLLTGGFPCQDLSIAGGRNGLAGKQSGLWFEMARIIEMVKPKWVIIENVPGLLSSRNGRDMAEILKTLSEIGYCVAWRVLDARYFGVAQRRKRVWIVGSFGNTDSVRVLFEQKSDRGNCKKVSSGREKRFCITTRDGERQDPTNETIIGTTIRTSESGKQTQGYIAETVTAKSYGDKGWPLQNETSQIIANTIRSNKGGTGSPKNTTDGIIASPITANIGSEMYLRRANFIAEINANRKRATDGFSRKLDTYRGRCLGNAIVSQVAMTIMEGIKEMTRRRPDKEKD